ncbi:MAG TPA: 4-(cytidine 5'-diphospho)-2-C-methyl-D-erythritol kinase, partial [Planctomycetaceae bacterium]|nr:4-(cytidine 5'-diphospho)-2-C-methyl-D-erythritol kinase [Planctomycetaceae bacterium]
MLVYGNGEVLVAQAPAKLNLFLEVLGKRADGYHELETLMVSVGLYDTLVFKEGHSKTIAVRCLGAGERSDCGEGGIDSIPTGRDNLVVQAAHLLRDHTGVQRGAEITVWKRIPPAAGLAGGSSDAAATLVALTHLWNVPLSAAELHPLAVRLGSDVAFFLARTPAAVCRGRGEVIEPVPLPMTLQFVIVRPPTGLSTSHVYRACQPSSPARSCRPLIQSLTAGRLAEAGRLFHNALVAPAEELNKDVTLVRRIFSRQPVLGHSMSGSGTACFGLCTTRCQALALARQLAA